MRWCPGPIGELRAKCRPIGADCPSQTPAHAVWRRCNIAIRADAHTEIDPLQKNDNENSEVRPYFALVGGPRNGLVSYRSYRLIALTGSIGSRRSRKADKQEAIF